MHKYIKVIHDFYGSAWLNEQWKKFLMFKSNDDPDNIDSKQIEAELKMHPLMYMLANYLGDSKLVDLNKPFSETDGMYQVLLHLGRDIELLSFEISQRGSKLKLDLLKPNEFNSHRFMLLIAAGYKILGYKVEFIPQKQGHKMPDIHVWKSEKQDFVIECKQRDQNKADFERYLFTAVLAEKIFPILKAKNIKKITIEIYADLKLEPHKDVLEKIIRIAIACGRFEPIYLENEKIKILFYNTDSRGNYDQILYSERNINKVTYVSRCEDAFVAADCKNSNVIFLDKEIKEEKVLTDLLIDANLKEKDGKKLIVYYDLGRSYESWVEIIVKKLFENRTTGLDVYPNIDCLFACQTMEKYKEGKIFYQPFFTSTARLSSMGGDPQQLELVGLQGDTGIDHYFLEH